MVMKRKASDLEPEESQRKRLRSNNSDRLSTLSHELTLRVLSFLPVPDLIVCHRVSRVLHALAADSQIWKALYYNRFVRPRASRLPGIRDSGVPADSLYFSSKLSKWLDEESLVRRGKETNWKRQYKLRDNWSKGTCAVSEIPVAEETSVPPILVQMHNSTIYMADRTNGLRAWNSSSRSKILAKTAFGAGHGSPPTSLAVDACSGSDTTRIAVGFQNGSFTVYDLDAGRAAFEHKYSHEPSSNGMLTAIALSSNYLATMTATQLLSLYRFEDDEPAEPEQAILDAPRLLHSLHSHTVWPPLTLAIRPTPESVLVTIAYALPTYLSGWTVGIQEMRMSPSGDLMESRLASAIDQHFRPLTFSTSPTRSPAGLGTNTFSSFQPFSEANQIHSKPTSLSYTHPYLLVSHPDNTLTLYLVSSSTESLSISAGSRLWGHTSSVSGAHVGGRGKAVSVSSRGDELRVWELEGGLTTAASRRKLASGGLSVQVRPEKRPTEDEKTVSDAVAARGNGLGLALEYKDSFDETSLTRGWIGFDEENVVVLKEKGGGGQALVVYDFA